MEYMESNMEKMNSFIENNEEVDTIDIDEFISPEDEVSNLILEYLAEEKACEETMEVIKDRFRKKKLDLNEYLEAIRSLSNTQFTCMAKRRKIMSVLSANKR